MDTIAINANKALNEDGQNKKSKVSGTAKAAMATGVAGMVVGVGGMAVADVLGLEAEDGSGAVATAATPNAENVLMENGIMEDVVVGIDPEDAMLEESVTDTDMIAEAISSPGEPYRPFSSNDSISDDALPVPQPDEVFIADNTEIDVIAEEDPVVDMICGVPEEISGMPEDAVCSDDSLYADNDSSYDDSDIQSDLMA